MRSSLRPVWLFAQLASALGLLSISLTGEIAAAWLIASWLAWTFSLLADRLPQVGAKLRGFETVVVAGMILLLLIDFLVFRFSVFIAITHFLLLFQIFKLLGEKARKDCLQIFLFSFFQILAACTLSVDAWHAAILLSLIPTATAMLFWNQMEREEEEAGGSAGAAVHRSYRRMAAGVCLAALPVNVLLTIGVFVLFPRLTLNAPLPGFNGRRSGYTDQMNLAQKGSLQENSSVVLWLSFPKPEERAAWDGYLRGDALSRFDGRQWSAATESGTRQLVPDSNGIFVLSPQLPGSPVIHQVITLADTSAATLFAIAGPLRITAPLPALQQSAEGNLHWLNAWRRPLRYEAVSESVSRSDVRQSDVQLPAIALERIRTLTTRIAGTGAALEQARNIEQYLQKNYRYSVDYGNRIPENPVDYFLFDRRAGSCGHFASAMALMLRLQKIPSRLVAGYLKGEWNEPAQSVVIRERDAHAWVEAYFPATGWTFFDPSPRAAPGSLSHRRWLTLFEQYIVYFDLQWNRFVIQYDLYSQIRAFETLKGASGRWGTVLSRWWSKIERPFHHPRGFTSATAQDESSLVNRFPAIKIGAFSFLALISVFLIKQHRTSCDSAILFYSRFLKKMERAGCPKQSWETGEEFAVRLMRQKPEQTLLARHTTEKYYQLRFRKGDS